MMEKFVYAVVGVAIAVGVLFGAHLLAGCEQVRPIGVAYADLTGPVTVTPDTVTCDAGTTESFDGTNINFVGGSCYYQLPVVAGDAIGSVTLPVVDNGYANGHTLDGNNVIAELVSRTPGRSDVLIASASSNGSGTAQTLKIASAGGYVVQTSDAQILVEVIGIRKTVPTSPSTVPSSAGTLMVIPQTPSITTVVPISPPSVTGPLIQQPVTISGAGSSSRPLIIPLATTVGEVITGIRARVTDNQNGINGPTDVEVYLATTTDDAEAFYTVATSPSSDGTGHEQTIGVSLSHTVAKREYDFAIVHTGKGSAPCTVWRLEVDHTP